MSDEAVAIVCRRPPAAAAPEAPGGGRGARSGHAEVPCREQPAGKLGPRCSGLALTIEVAPVPDRTHVTTHPAATRPSCCSKRRSNRSPDRLLDRTHAPRTVTSRGATMSPRYRSTVPRNAPTATLGSRRCRLHPQRRGHVGHPTGERSAAWQSPRLARRRVRQLRRSARSAGRGHRRATGRARRLVHPLRLRCPTTRTTELVLTCSPDCTWLAGRCWFRASRGRGRVRPR